MHSKKSLLAKLKLELQTGVSPKRHWKSILKLSHLHGNDNPVDELAQVKSSADNVREVELTVQKLRRTHKN